MLQKCRKHEMYVDPTVTPMGPRSLHFRGRRPIPRLPKLASSCARPAAALRDLLELRRGSVPGRELRVRLRDREHQVAEEERAAQGHRA